jgi:hypothetical protein
MHPLSYVKPMQILPVISGNPECNSQNLNLLSLPSLYFSLYLSISPSLSLSPSLQFFCSLLLSLLPSLPLYLHPSLPLFLSPSLFLDFTVPGPEGDTEERYDESQQRAVRNCSAPCVPGTSSSAPFPFTHYILRCDSFEKLILETLYSMTFTL